MKRPTRDQLEWAIIALFVVPLLVVGARAAINGRMDRDDVVAMGLVIGVAAIAFMIAVLGSAFVDAWARLVRDPEPRPDIAGEAANGLLRYFAAGWREARVAKLSGGGEEVTRPYRGEVVGARVLADGRVALWVPVEGEQSHVLDVMPSQLPPSIRAALGIRSSLADGLAGLVVDKAAESALRLLFGPFQCRRLWLEGGRLHAETGLSSAVLSPGWLDQALDGLLKLGTLLEAMRVVVRPALRTASREAERALCPYCHDGVEASDVHACPGCATGHHEECWQEGGGCTILGCAENPRKAPPPRVRA